jgi:hypothetical protein
MQTQANTIGGKSSDTPQEIKFTTKQEMYGKI